MKHGLREITPQAIDRMPEEELQRLRAQIADAQSANNENRDADDGISGEDE